eukprot:gene7891-27071_t
MATIVTATVTVSSDSGTTTTTTTTTTPAPATATRRPAEFCISDPMLPNIPTPANADAFRQLDAMGVTLAMISGRCYVTTAEMMDHVGLDQYVIPFHGGSIFGPFAGKATRPLLQSWHLDDALLATCLKVSEAAGAMPMCYTANGIWTCDTTDKDVQTMNFKNAEGESALEWWARVGEFPNPCPGSENLALLPPSLKARVFKLVIACTPDELSKPSSASSVNTALRSVVKPADGNVIGPVEFWVEVLHPDCNKATAMKWLAENVVGSTLEQTITFGDGVNDLEMLRDAGLGIAMANARPEVKRVAKLTSQFTNEESAVAKEIATLLETGRVGAKQ